MTRKQWVALALALMLILGGFVWAFMPQPVPVDAIKVSRGTFEQTIEEDGKTRVRERYIISAPLAGELDRIEIHAGDVVKKDQVLASIWPSVPALLDVRVQREMEERVGSAEAGLARAGSTVARAKAALEQARADLKRVETLAKQGFVSSANREQVELAVQLRTRESEAAAFEQHAAAHQLDQARAALLHARTQGRGKSGRAFEVRSPISGHVLRVAQENEGVTPIGAPIMELAEVAKLEAVVDVLSTDAVQIRSGAQVYLDSGNGVHAVGRVRLVEPAAFTKVSALGVEEQRVNIVIDFAAPPEQMSKLGDAYRVDARIVVTRAENAVKVPVGALFREGEQWRVFVVKDKRATKQAVKLGNRNGIEAIVSEGLQVGDQVVVYPSDSVKDGVRVEVRSG